MLIEQHLIFKGVVQGVGFRATACRLAYEIGLAGTAKNLNDGTVEIYIQGQKELIENFIQKLKNHFGNKIESVNLIVESVSTSKFTNFNIL